MKRRLIIVVILCALAAGVGLQVLWFSRTKPAGVPVAKLPGDHIAEPEQPSSTPDNQPEVVAPQTEPGPLTNVPAGTQATLQGLQKNDWIPLLNRYPKHDRFPGDFKAAQTDKGLHFSTGDDTGILWLTNKHVLYGDFHVVVKVVFPAARGLSNRISSFGLRPSNAEWLRAITVPKVEAFELAHTLEVIKQGDDLQFITDGELIAGGRMSSLTELAPQGEVAASACHFFIEMIDEAELWITDVEITRPDRAPDGISQTNNFAPQDRPLPTIFDRDRNVLDEQVLQLPGFISDVAIGGDGRFLIVHIPATKKLLLFDTQSRSIVGRIPAEDSDVFLTAGASKLIVALNDSDRIEEWSLSPVQRTAVIELGSSVVTELAMGSAAESPAIVRVLDGARSEMRFLDAGLKWISSHVNESTTKIKWSDRVRFRASREGTVFGITTAKGKYRLHYHPIESIVTLTNSNQTIIPGPYGQHLYGVNTNEPPRTYGRSDSLLVPSVHGPFCVSVSRDHHDPSYKLAELAPAQVAIYVRGLQEPLAAFNDVDLTGVNGVVNGLSEVRFSEEKRILLIPASKALITIPRTNDRIVFRRLDPEQLLADSDFEYLFVTSPPPPPVTVRDETFRHQFEVRSRGEVAGFRLTVGTPPRGMEITDKGLVSWEIPAEFKHRGADIRIEIADNANRAHRFSFQVLLVDPPVHTGPARPEPFRLWTDRETQRSAKAKFIVREGDNVRLEREDGVQFVLPLARLSDADRDYIESNSP